MLDELMIDWGDLPEEAEARLFLPSVAPAQILNLRNLRHAPGTVVAEADATLRLRVGGVTYIPPPPVPGDRLPGVLTVTLPEGVRAPALRGRRDASARRLDCPQRRLPDRGQPAQGGRARPARNHAGRPAARAARRYAGERPLAARAGAPAADRASSPRGFAADAGGDWEDPTVWTDANGDEHPVRGPKIRVVLESVLIVDDRDPSLKGAARSTSRCSSVRRTTAASSSARVCRPGGHFELGRGERLEIGEEIFVGFVEDDLGIRINAMERDTFDPDDNLGSYTRTFSCPAETWLGSYQPGDEPIDPEDVGYWQVSYRIERA